MNEVDLFIFSYKICKILSLLKKVSKIATEYYYQGKKTKSKKLVPPYVYVNSKTMVLEETH